MIGSVHSSVESPLGWTTLLARGDAVISENFVLDSIFLVDKDRGIFDDSICLDVAG